ncbi:glycerophosphodiester phosphodiesterase family protein [uncultured Roseibium sp.]|uniref:glycerophosphodiester phosphodiesterase family protein n=1 Tax=uncultured Roseibium sp. TaxID=1936171 RepID=UPI00260A171F|nr:glycerophosphodiester phosphodiesterase family protein [uncultured Roseibium sp.]
MSFGLERHIRRTGKLPLIYGHRGARGEIPENSMDGFRLLDDIGVTAVEFDVQNARDHQPVIWHDATLQVGKVRNRSGIWLDTDGPKICETSVLDLKSYDIGSLQPGSKARSTFPEQSALSNIEIPTLEELFEWAKASPRMVLNLEVKSFANRTDLGDSPEELLGSILPLVEKSHLAERIIVSSFDWRVLHAFRQAAPEIPLGYLTYQNLEDPEDDANIYDNSPWMDGLEWSSSKRLPDLVKEAGGTVWSPYFSELTQDDLDLAHRLGLVVNVWTVNSVEDMKRMKDMGVDGVITDYPTRAKALWDDIMTAEEQGNLSVNDRSNSQGKGSVSQHISTE